MAEKVKLWFDPEGDFLEVRFSDAPGYMRETEHEALNGARGLTKERSSASVFSGLAAFVRSVRLKRN